MRLENVACRLPGLFLVLIACLLLEVSTQSGPNVNGDPSCPCLRWYDAGEIDPADVTPELYEKLGNALNSTTTYGIGCQPHDIDTPQCTSNECSINANLVPQPIGCDLTWCERSWCFVDPNDCQLLNRRSASFPLSDRFYSYATCGDADSFTQNNRLAALSENILQVGLNSNTGGWQGAYRNDGVDFVGPIDNWSGPLIEFLKEAAYRGDFRFNITEPPAFLREKSNDFFNSNSNFDYCVYAASLGYLDLCVAQYTVSDQRASMTDWLLLDSAGLYLVAQVDGDGVRTGWQSFMESVNVIFLPFTTSCWCFICLFVIPILGCLFIVHEGGKSGSAYPRQEYVLITEEDGTSEVKKQKVPWYRNVVKSIYIATLATLQQSYEQRVISTGGMIHLLGISFAILTLIAAYTANLAALLTQRTQVTSIQSLSDAVRAGYHLCAERKNMDSVVAAYQNVDPNMFANDPVSEGGDGAPGFNCGNCTSRRRVFDFLDPQQAERSFRYCHAAIATREDLEVLQAQGLHCNKTIVGRPIQFTQTGIPIFENVSPQLISFFLKLKNDGVLDQQIIANRPSSQCPVLEGGEGNSLSITQLSGIWVVSFGFAFAALLVTFLTPFWRRRVMKSTANVRRLHKRDQRGGQVDVLSDMSTPEKAALSNPRLGLGHANSWQGQSKTDENGRTSVQTSMSVNDLHLARANSWQNKQSTTDQIDCASAQTSVNDLQLKENDDGSVDIRNATTNGHAPASC